MKTEFLSPKQQLFCDEYLTDLNATRAALRAGYSKTTALNGQLMQLPKIKEYLKQHTDARAQKLEVSRDMVLNELRKIAFSNFGNYFLPNDTLKQMSDLNDDEKAALWNVKISADGTVSLKMYNKLAALEKVAKHIGFFEPEDKEKAHSYTESDILDDKDLPEDEPGDEPEEELVFEDNDGNPLYPNGLPYGPMAGVFRFDITDHEEVGLTKLKCYEHIQATMPVADFDVRQYLSKWLTKELNKFGLGMHGDCDDTICKKFMFLRNFMARKVGCNLQ